MNTYNWNTLSWNKLMSPNIIGKKILIIYKGEDEDILPQNVVTVVGTDYVGNEHVLLVEDPEDPDDILIITREFKGRLWESYLIVEGF